MQRLREASTLTAGKTAGARIDREEGGCGEQFENVAFTGWLVETLGNLLGFRSV
jgi:hypothetical protein